MIIDDLGYQNSNIIHNVCMFFMFNHLYNFPSAIIHDQSCRILQGDADPAVVSGISSILFCGIRKALSSKPSSKLTWAMDINEFPYFPEENDLEMVPCP